MTYCVAVKVKSGLVFLSDSRTNAGVDDISTTRKMSIFSKPGDRSLIVLSAGNLAITQSVKTKLKSQKNKTIWNVKSLYEVAEIIGECIRDVYKRDGDALKKAGLEFSCSFILGGRISGEQTRLFKIYSAGNFIEADKESLYFQIGESKYGKPILDRVLHSNISTEAAAKCLLLSMDSTIRSNVSVGMPLELLKYQTDLQEPLSYKLVRDDDREFRKLKTFWNEHLEEGFKKVENISWDQTLNYSCEYPKDIND